MARFLHSKQITFPFEYAASLWSSLIRLWIQGTIGLPGHTRILHWSKTHEMHDLKLASIDKSNARSWLGSLNSTMSCQHIGNDSCQQDVNSQDEIHFQWTFYFDACLFGHNSSPQFLYWTVNVLSCFNSLCNTFAPTFSPSHARKEPGLQPYLMIFKFFV